jgi:prolyl oligopeptidase PreP (S9A serine peptidase family)
VIIKRWARGQPLAEAVTVFEGEAGDVSVYASVDRTPGFERTVFGRATDFYNDRLFLLQRAALQPIDKPSDANLSFWRRHLLLELRSDWAVAGRTHPRGSLLVADAAAYLRGERELTALFTPTATRSLAGFTTTHGTVLVDVLDNVASRLEEWRPQGGRWVRREVQAPFPGTLGVAPLHDPLLAEDDLAEAYQLTYADFLTPDALLLGRTGSDERETLKSRPAFFDAAACAWSSSSRPRRTARGCPTSWSGRAARRPTAPTRRCSTATAASRSRCSPATRAPSAAPGPAAAASTSSPTSAAAANTARAGTRRRSSTTASAPTTTSSPWPRT